MHAEDYVHEYHDAHGRRRFVVAEYRDGRYYAPQRPDVVVLTGAHGVCPGRGGLGEHRAAGKGRS